MNYFYNDTDNIDFIRIIVKDNIPQMERYN